MIGSLLQADFEEIIQAKDWDGLREALSELDPSDIAELIIDLPGEDEGIIFRVLPREKAADVFEYLPRDVQRNLLKSLSSATVTSILDEMTPDDRMRLFDTLPAEVTRQLLDSLSPDELKSARELLGYPKGAVGRYMTPEYVALPPDIPASEALDLIRKMGRGKETLNIIYIINEKGRLLEDLPLGSLVLADTDMMIGDIEDRPLVSVKANSAAADVVQAFEHYDRAALPVVDDEGVMLGIITHDDVLEFAERRATDEIQKLGGSEALDEPYTTIGFWSMFKKRGGWLSALFLGEMLTATAMGFFEKEIERAVVLALFVPLIISSGGNSGSQGTSIIIRALALKELKLRDWTYVFRRELATGLALGLLLGIIGFFRILAWQWLGWKDYGEHYMLVGMTVWASLIGVVMFGSLAGSMLPFLLRKIGFDPATCSAPFVATLVDVTGLCIFFGTAMVILHNTLLKPEVHAPATQPAVAVVAHAN